MKKVFLGLFVVFAYALTFAVANVVIANASFDDKGKPANIRTVPIAVTASGAVDSLDAVGGAPHVYGPINLCFDGSRPKYGGFKIRWAGNAWASGDSLRLEYQVLPTSKVSDTNSIWRSLGQNIALADTIAYQSLSNIVGNSVVFKLTPIDVTPVTFVKPIWVIFEETTSAYVEIKR